MTGIIRQAKPEEFETIRKQRLAAYEPYAKQIPAEHWQFLKGTLSAESDQNTGVNVFVYEKEGALLGSIVLFPSKTKAYEWDTEQLAYPEIRMLAVDPGARGQGVAKALVRHCIAYSTAKGYPFIGLHTGSFMKPAMALYEGMGFERIPELDHEPMNDGIIIKAYRRSLQ